MGSISDLFMLFSKTSREDEAAIEALFENFENDIYIESDGFLKPVTAEPSDYCLWLDEDGLVHNIIELKQVVGRGLTQAIAMADLIKQFKEAPTKKQLLAIPYYPSSNAFFPLQPLRYRVEKLDPKSPLSHTFNVGYMTTDNDEYKFHPLSSVIEPQNTAIPKLTPDEMEELCLAIQEAHTLDPI